MKNKWILGAIILGLSFFVAILFAKPIGVSTQFSVISGKIHQIVHDTISETALIEEDSTRDSGYRSSNAYYDKSDGKIAKAIMNLNNYGMLFFISIFIGAFLGKLTMGKKLNANNEIPKEKLGSKRIFRSLISGALLLFGARFAGGCTSGHMMSGMMQSSVSGFIFAAVVFMVAIPVAIGGETR
ncbi:MAG: YeeE/YedE thiosulfate transporter family protein [Tissierellia bacterium]|nr:YeeE/YedE thiosulfate transporter family protein [Tissierellia bacterium]